MSEQAVPRHRGPGQGRDDPRNSDAVDGDW